MKKILSIIPVTGLILLAGCTKNRLSQIQPWDNTDKSTSLVKFINAYTALTPSAAATPNGPTVDIYVNNVKINATAVAYGGIFPNTSGGYSAVPSGMVNIKAVLNRPSGGGLPSDTIANGNFQLGPSTPHSIILVDTLPNPTPQNPILMVVGESVTSPAYGKYRVRFMNLIPNTDTLEVFSAANNAVIATGIRYKFLSDWVDLPIPSASDALTLRKVGTTTAIATTTLLGGSQRCYTLWARGNPAITGRTRTLSSYTNQ